IEKTIFLFIYIANENDLFNFIYESIKNNINYPQNLKIIPMSFQDDTTIAPLFFRSDATITRSGGSTILELLAVANGKVLIHSEGKLKQNLIKGMPYWEVGNALYLKKFKNSELVNTDNFVDQLELLFSS
ncbi:MAG: hypothetical protein JXA94_03255, partial [Parachlamydiales bacterium]|nr:hypothetical protein [Parachlamydiales bacterium]